MIRYFKCVVCGKRCIDKSSTQNKRYCSKECRDKYYSAARFQVCKYNEGVVCNKRECKNCGWNPEVAAAKKRAVCFAYMSGRKFA